MPFKELLVISGKGGTGKTSLAAALIELELERASAPVVACDADVDAANLALLIDVEDGAGREFTGGSTAVIEPSRCTGCGACLEACRFSALERIDNRVRVIETACEGCGVCRLVCPADAVELAPETAGIWWVGRGEDLTLVHAELGVAQDNSGKLVARVRREARQLADDHEAELLIVDGPPGIGCPVHAALTGVDLALVVTEPSPAGLHDLERALETTEHFERPAAVVINKCDLAPAVSERIAELCERRKAPLVARLPFDRRVPGELARGRSPLAVPRFRELVDGLLTRLHSLLWD